MLRLKGLALRWLIPPASKCRPRNRSLVRKPRGGSLHPTNDFYLSVMKSENTNSHIKINREDVRTSVSGEPPPD